MIDLEKALKVEIEADPFVAEHIGPGEVTCEASGTLADWQPVRCRFIPDEPFQFGSLYVSMLDGGRYAWAQAECCGAMPAPEDYPTGSFCRDLFKPPPDSNPIRPGEYKLTYGLAVYYWLTEGGPDRMDADHDGRPCETVYPASEVAAFWNSVRTL